MKLYMITFLAAFQFCYSQVANSYQFGVKAGANFSHIVRDEISKTELNESYMKLGFAAGVFVDKSLSEYTSLRVEFLYNQVGSNWGKNMFPQSQSGNYAEYDLRYLTIPVYFKLKSRIGNLLKDFDFMIGPCYSYNVYARQKVVIEAMDQLNYGPNNLREEINLHEFGVLTGIKLPFIGNKVSISLHYYWALTNLYSNETTTYPDGLDDKSSFKNRNL